MTHAFHRRGKNERNFGVRQKFRIQITRERSPKFAIMAAAAAAFFFVSWVNCCRPYCCISYASTIVRCDFVW